MQAVAEQSPSNSIARAAHIWERQPDNWYVEPEWVTRRLCEVERFEGRSVDPCAGRGHTVLGARAAGVVIEGMDLRQRAPFISGGHDFFDPPRCHGTWPCDNIISNPPYGVNERAAPGEMARLEEQFVLLALQRARCKVAVFLLSGWINAEKRQRWLEGLPLYREYKVSPRPSCPPGHVIEAGEKPGNGTGDYSWFVFLRGFEGRPTVHFLRRDG